MNLKQFKKCMSKAKSEYIVSKGICSYLRFVDIGSELEADGHCSLIAAIFGLKYYDNKVAAYWMNQTHDLKGHDKHEKVTQDRLNAILIFEQWALATRAYRDWIKP